MTSGLNIDTFINGLIFGNLLAMGYRAESLQNYFPTYTSDFFVLHTAGMFLTFFGGGFFALLFNLTKKINHQLVLFVMLFAWLSGVGTIGYYYSAPEWALNGYHNNTTPQLENDLVLNLAIHYTLICFCGGYFFWGSMVDLLDAMRTHRDKLSILFNILSPAVFGLVVNVYYVSIVQEHGGYLYSYRIVLLASAVLCLVRLLALTPPKPNPTLSTTPSSFFILHHTMVFVQSVYIYLPFIQLAVVPAIPISATLNGLFGGMIVSMFVTGLLVILNNPMSVLDVIAWFAQIAWIVLFATWHTIESDPVGFGWGFGIAFGFTWTSHVYEILTLSDCTLSMWMLWRIIAIVLGMSISMVLAVFMDWGGSGIANVATAPAISMLLGVYKMVYTVK